MDIPSVPRINRQPRSSDGTLELAWNPPVSDGGSAITAYAIGIYGDPGYSGTIYSTGAASTDRYIKITDNRIPNGTNLYCTIAAVNATGTGPVAKFRAPWQTGNKPGAPASVDITNLGNGAYTVSWTPPNPLPNATIFWYVITTLNNNLSDPSIPQISVSGNTRSKTIQGLNPASTYRFIVQAVNCPGYSPRIASTNPIEFLQGIQYAGSGNTWVKDVGFDATLLDGTATWNTQNNGLVLNGSTCWNFPSLGLLTTYTINVWYKNTGPGIGESPCIITESFTNGSNINFLITTGVETLPSGYYGCGFYDNSWVMGTPFELIANVWTNIQYTWDGTNIVTYINGNPIGSVAPGVPVGGTGLPIRIGRRWDIEQYVTGIIGEVRIFNYALSSAEILADYNESAPNFS